MQRARVFILMLAGLGSVFLGSAALAHDHDEGHRWEGREWNRRDWDRHDWDRHYSDRAGRRRYHDGRGWIYLLPPPPHVGWHWDPYQGRYCP